MPAQPKAISLFTGCGGMDYGFEAAGFKTAVAVEIDHACCETLRRNRNWPVLETDLIALSKSRTLLEKLGLGRGEADLLFGGPPCQPFSKSGYWVSGDSRRLNDPRAETLAAYMRVVERTLPRAFVLENVTGLAYAGKDEGLQFLLTALERLNRRTKSRYRAYYKVLKAAEYGVPQLRERFFLVAARDGTPFEFPEPMFSDATETEETLFNRDSKPGYRTAWDAIGDLPEPTTEDVAMRGRWAELLPTVPEGNNYLWHTDRGGGAPLFGWRRRFWNFLLKLAKDKPAWTIQAQPGPSVGPFHWNNRRLTIRELCRLQTFPDDVEIVGNRTTAQRQIGNAVPSLLTEVIGRKIRADLLGGRDSAKPLRLLPPDRSPVPPPAPVLPVPQKYLGNCGRHAAHPGTGKGFGALARLRASA